MNSRDYGEAAPVTRDTARADAGVNESLSVLNHSIDSALKTFDGLYDRMQAALIPAMPEQPKPIAGGTSPEPIRSPLEQSIYAASRKVVALEKTISDAYSRIRL